MKNNQHSEVVSFRIDTALKNELLNECEKKGINFSTLLNQTFTKYGSWTRYTEEMEVMLVFRPVFKSMLERLDKDFVIKIARTKGKQELKNLVQFIFGEFNFKNTAKVIDYYLQNAKVKFRHTAKNGKHLYVLQHDLGDHWSYYFTAEVSSVLKELNYQLINEKHETNHLSFKIVSSLES